MSTSGPPKHPKDAGPEGTVVGAHAVLGQVLQLPKKKTFELKKSANFSVLSGHY